MPRSNNHALVMRAMVHVGDANTIRSSFEDYQPSERIHHRRPGWGAVSSAVEPSGYAAVDGARSRA